MIDEGFIPIKWRGRGSAALLRRKQWWSFEGMDEDRGVYFVFLAMQSFPSGYVSLTVINLKNGRRFVLERLTGVEARPGDSVDVSAQGKWGSLRFSGCAEDKWVIEIESDAIRAKVEHRQVSAMRRDRLLTKKIDYSILQSALNRMEGRVSFGGRDCDLSGYGYCEHAWGVQPRRSQANWLHFWSPAASGVVMDCLYDVAVPHNYSYVWLGSENRNIHSPAQFSFNAASPLATWKITSPDLELDVSPILAHRTIKRIPFVLPYIDIDYHELLVKAQGSVNIDGARIPIDGIGKYDYNDNKW
ncbi:MAG TPA: DUF2804 family protein [bacterium]|nr:DUF2804 family protein [bacterium]